ncbi:MAG: DUF924 family protein [Thiotrichales bacterium]
MKDQDILDFWFSEEMRSRWFSSTPELDLEIKQRFEDCWIAACDGKLDSWAATANGALGLIIVLDQFPLNMYRGTAESFASEAKAIQITRIAVTEGLDRQLEPERQAFMYMPLMHSESMEDQNHSVELFEKPGLESSSRFAKHHREIIQRFGRFPHRNALLGRISTDAEIAYLNSKEAFLG